MERTDDLQRGGLKLIQDTDLFCFGTDSVLLADFANVKKGGMLADLGCASGILMFLMYARNPQSSFLGVEVQWPLYELCLKNIRLNKLDGKIQAIYGDMAEISMDYKDMFDTVVVNPPYEKPGTGGMPANESQLIARFEIKITFKEICAAARRMLKVGGSFYVIHRTGRLAEQITELKYHKLEPKRMMFVHKNALSNAEYVLIGCIKDGRPYLKIEPPLIMYNQNGTKTKELTDIYGKT